MNKEISKILRDRLRENGGLPFVEKYAGLVQTVTEEVATEETKTKKRFPVATEVVLNDVCSSHEEIITPDSSLKGVLYFEDGGTTTQGKVGKRFQFTSLLTLVCWINRAKVVSNIYSEITGIAIQNIMTKLKVDENPENVSMFTGLTVSVIKIRHYFRPIWGCEKCFAGQTALWIFILNWASTNFNTNAPFWRFVFFFIPKYDETTFNVFTGLFSVSLSVLLTFLLSKTIKKLNYE